jgi:Uma2 family endonuclease
MSSPKLRTAEVFYPETVIYPETDGQPMAESDLHRDLMLDLIAAARHHFRDVPEVYVSGNLLLYFEEGNPRVSVSPDFFVVRGIHKRRRRTFKLWEERKGPEVVVELTSPSTHLEDLGRKRAVYESLGVKEYYLFDPEGVRFQPRLRGFRLVGGVFQPVTAARGPRGVLVFGSDVLGLELHARGASLRLFDPRAGELVPIPEEMLLAVERERARTREESQRARDARALAEKEGRRAEKEGRRAEKERLRAETAEAELRQARAELARLKRRRPR